MVAVANGKRVLTGKRTCRRTNEISRHAHDLAKHGSLQ